MSKKIILILIFFLTSCIIFTSATYATSIDDMITSADNFLTLGSDDAIDSTKLKETSNYIYNTLLVIAVIVAVVVGTYLGIKFMLESAEDKAKIKESLIPFCVGCFVIFGAFGIWHIAVDTGNAVTGDSSFGGNFNVAGTKSNKLKILYEEGIIENYGYIREDGTFYSAPGKDKVLEEDVTDRLFLTLKSTVYVHRDDGYFVARRVYGEGNWAGVKQGQEILEKDYENLQYIDIITPREVDAKFIYECSKAKKYGFTLEDGYEWFYVSGKEADIKRDGNGIITGLSPGDICVKSIKSDDGKLCNAIIEDENHIRFVIHLK